VRLVKGTVERVLIEWLKGQWGEGEGYSLARLLLPFLRLGGYGVYSRALWHNIRGGGGIKVA